jgi:AcrR family transcriptional regulator
MSDAVTRLDRKSPARERLLETAGRLFYAEGIHAVGVDRLIAAAGVTKVTFYRHFPAKDDLVRVYLEREDQRMQDAVAGIIAGLEPAAAIRAIFEAIARGLGNPDFRGSPFVNTAAEYPDLDHPVGRAIRAHREWLRELLTKLLTQAGHPDPRGSADLLMLARDGAMSFAQFDGPEPAQAALRKAVDAILR